MEVITPRTLDEALRLKSERPDARPIAGGTDLLVELNFDRTRPETILNLAEVPELKGWSRENGSLRLGAGLTYTEAMKPELAELLPALAEASRTVGSPQIRNRGTIGGNLGTASPAGDAHPPLLVEDATVEEQRGHDQPLVLLGIADGLADQPPPLACRPHEEIAARTRPALVGGQAAPRERHGNP